MRQKSLVIGLLVVMAFLVSGFTYAYWASSVVGNNLTATGTVTVGSGNAVETDVVVGNQTGAGPLVPVGFAQYSPNGSVEFVILQFSVTWISDNDLADGYLGTLSFGYSNLLIDGVNTNIGLLTVAHQIGGSFNVTTGAFEGTPNTQIEADGGPVIVYVRITMTAPGSQAVYNQVATKDITFTGTFTVTP